MGSELAKSPVSSWGGEITNSGTPPAENMKGLDTRLGGHDDKVRS